MPRASATDRSLAAAALCSAIAVACAGCRQSTESPAGTSSDVNSVTFTGDIAPIVFARCATCHHPGEAAPEGIPPLVAEISDDDTSATEMTRKLEDYFSAGVKLVWVIDLEKHSATAYTSPKKSTTISAGGALGAGRAVPGFKLPVKQLFRQLGAVKGRK